MDETDNSNLISESPGGAHAVFLAVRHDPALKGSVYCTPAGRVFYRGQRVDAMVVAEILVYLSGRYGVRPTEFELLAGLRAGGIEESDDQRRRRNDGAVFSRDKALNAALHGWLKKRGPERGAFTVQAVAEDLLPVEYQEAQRQTEIRIASMLRGLGFNKRRQMVNGERKYRWIWPLDLDLGPGPEMVEDSPVVVELPVPASDPLNEPVEWANETSRAFFEDLPEVEEEPAEVIPNIDEFSSDDYLPPF